MRVVRAEFAGLCFGVRDALAATRRVEDPAAVTILGDLVHNPEVIAELDRKGFVRVTEKERDRLPASPVVMVTAHGISERRRAGLAAAGRTLLDTTCPLVRVVHTAARRFADEGRFVVVLGRRGHVEVQGVVEDLSRCAVVETEADIRDFGAATIGVVCQTTLPPASAEALLEAVRRANPGAELDFADTVCLPTRQRQQAVLDLLPRIELLVVVGGRHSNNTQQLAHLARSRGVPAIQVERADDLDPAVLEGVECVGLTAGTSTLDATLDAVHARLAALPVGISPSSRSCAATPSL